MKFAFLLTFLIQLFCFLPAAAQTFTPSRIETLRLGETNVKINIYEKKGARLTLVVLHHNEQTGLNLAKEIVREKGGRLIELIVLSDSGRPARYLKFSWKGTDYRIDPNRIFTANGRSTKCSLVPEDAIPPVQIFAENLLKIVLPPRGNRLRRGEQALVAVHNNSNIDESSGERKTTDLTAFAYIKGGKTQHPLTGEYHPQVEGVYIANEEDDEDNFFFISTPKLMSFLTGEGFNVVLQKQRAKLMNPDCRVDDGSLSVFAGQQNIPYINIEADNKTGAARQRQMLEAVYKLIRQK